MLTTVGPSGREDLVSFQVLVRADKQLVSRALKFLSVIVKMGSHREMFASPETLKAFCEKIILPNMGMRGKQSLPTMLMNRKRRGAV
jgi:exportin-2 (importin alpha re-exporter)